MTLEAVIRILRITLSRPVLLAVAGGALLLLAGECRRHRSELADDRAPRIAVNVPRFERYKPEAIEASIQAWRPTIKDSLKVAETFGVKVKSQDSDEGADLLAHKLIPVDCGDGEVRKLEIIATLPEGDGPREVEIRTVQSGRKFFGPTGTYGLGALYGAGSDGQRWRAYGFAEPLRVGRVRLRGEAGVESRAGVTDWYAMVGGEVRF